VVQAAGLARRGVVDPGVYLVKKDRTAALKAGAPQAVKEDGGAPQVPPIVAGDGGLGVEATAEEHAGEEVRATILVLSGSIPPESWNKVGTRLIPKLRSGNQLSVGVTFSVQVDGAQMTYLRRELEQILADLNLTDKVRIEVR